MNSADSKTGTTSKFGVYIHVNAFLLASFMDLSEILISLHCRHCLNVKCSSKVFVMACIVTIVIQSQDWMQCFVNNMLLWNPNFYCLLFKRYNSMYFFLFTLFTQGEIALEQFGSGHIEIIIIEKKTKNLYQNVKVHMWSVFFFLFSFIVVLFVNILIMIILAWYSIHKIYTTYS